MAFLPRRNAYRAAFGFALATLLNALAMAQDGTPPRDIVTLSSAWQIQPATDPAVPPRDGDWGEYGPWDWRQRWRRIENRGTSWADVGREEVQSLWWRQTVEIPQAWIGRRFLLDFHRLEGDAIVFVNGQRVRELQRPGGVVDITGEARPGDNDVRVFVTRSYTGISRGYQDDPLRYITRELRRIPMERWAMGITAPVTLTARPRSHAIDNVFVRTSWREKSIAFDVDIQAAEPLQRATLVVRIADAGGAPALEMARHGIAVAPGTHTVTLESPWADAIPWQLDAGYVYTASVELLADDAILDRVAPVAFGFREVWTEGRQIILNGRPARFRLGWDKGLTPEALSFFRLMGYNAFEFQPNRTAWWADWNETPYIEPSILEEMDRVGAAALVLAPGVAAIDRALLNDERTRADYEREMTLWIRRHQNHPSILTWIVGMNYVGNRENIHATGMGRSGNLRGTVNEQVVEKAVSIAKGLDPTRLVFSHADGNVGDISTSNVYLNFVPLQERIEWPSGWAAEGDMPYMAVEFGSPYLGNFWKGPRFLMTEYLARDLGDAAYRSETLDGLKRTLGLGLAYRGRGMVPRVDLDEFPAWWDFQRMYVTETDRCWRAWGVTGWFHWDFDLAYGDPPGFNPSRRDHLQGRYRLLTERVTEPPDWVSKNFHIHRYGFQPLLAFIGGHPVFTDKTHAYRAGERIEKQVVVVWDGPGPRAVRIDWTASVDIHDGPPIAGGSEAVRLEAGDIRFVPIAFDAPDEQARTEATLRVSVVEDDRVSIDDAFAFRIYPATAPIAFEGRVALFDPQGHSAPWLAALGVEAVPLARGDSLDGVDALIVGRQAVAPGDTMPYSAADVARGLRVLVLEQTGDTWEGLGFRVLESLPRKVYAVEAGDPLMQGLEPIDLTHWRGSPDLLTEARWARMYDFYRGPRWTNRHAVASVVFELPQTVGFRPRLNAEFDLSYSPLLDFHYGRGRVTFCSLDLTGRVGVDPSATRLARNLLSDVLTAPLAPTRPVVVGEGVDQAFVDALLARRIGAPNAGALRVARAVPDAGDAADTLVLGASAQELAAAGLRTQRRALYRAEPPGAGPLRPVGRRLLRWRDAVEADTILDAPPDVAVLADGLFAWRNAGGASHLFAQIPHDAFDAHRQADLDWQQAVSPSRRTLRQLYAQIFTNLRAEPSEALAYRLTKVGLGRSYQTLGNWHVLGPFDLEERYDVKQALGREMPGEADALRGEALPDTRYTLDDGRTLDWRTTLAPDAAGFVNIGQALGRERNALAYLTRRVESAQARRARLRLGVDYWMKVWVNGELVYRVEDGHGAPLINRHRLDIDLREGVNVITLKVISGSKGFGFWANLSREGSDPAGGGEDDAASSLTMYPVIDPGYEPYEFHYW